MKHASKSWLGMFAACMWLTATAWSQPGGPQGSGSAGHERDDDGVIHLLDDFASVRVGSDASASVAAPPAQPQPAQYVAPPERLFEPDAPPMFRDVLVPRDSDVGFANTTPLDRMLWRVGRTNIDQYGYNGGFTTINTFIPLAIESDRSLWFVNPRANVTDYGNGGMNIGFGHRVYVPEDDRVYGASFWWDFDSGHTAEYHQMGGSFESIGRYFSMRGNFTLPMGRQRRDFGLTTGNAQFQGSQIAVEQVFTREYAMQQYDFELATPMPVLGPYGFDIGLGAYLLNGNGEDRTAGVSSRIHSQITENFWMNGIYTYDDMFGSNFSLNFEVTMPNGVPKQWFRRAPVTAALTDSVLRRYRVPVSRTTKRQTLIATDADGNPINVAFINPNRSTAGDGSLETPFMSMAEYMALTAAEREQFGVIYVGPRIDSTDTNLNTTVSLLDFQRLVGDTETVLPDGTVIRPRITVFVAGRQERVSLPRLVPGDTPTLPPLLSNAGVPGTNVVTLANGNEVSGFIIDAGGTADGIVGLGIDSFNLHDLEIQNAIRGIRITSDTTPVLGVPTENRGIIANTTITGLEGFETVSRRGITITHTAGDLELLIAENEVSGIWGPNNTGIGVEIIADGATINAADASIDDPLGIFNNVINNNGTGLQLTARNGATFDAAVLRLGEGVQSISENRNPNTAGFVALADSGSLLTLDAVQNNTISRNIGNGVSLIARDGGELRVPAFDPDGEIPDGVLWVNGFVGNNISANRGNGVSVLADNALVDASIGAIGAGNSITLNGRVTTIANQVDVVGSGVLLTTLNGGVVNGRIDGNLISRNVEAGIKIAPDGGLVELDSISGNMIVDNGFDDPNRDPNDPFRYVIPNGISGGDAIVFAPSNGGTFRVDEFTGNEIRGNRGAIIRVGGNGGIVDLGIIEGTIFDRRVAGSAGILFDADNATITGIIRGNTFIGSTSNNDLTFGIGGEIRGGTLDLVIENNLFEANADAGIGLILAESDNRTPLVPGTPPVTGTPLEGEAAQASLIIVNNAFVSTRVGNDDRFDGAGISLQLEGQERDVLLGQNDIDQDGVPDATPIPVPGGIDVTTNVQPASILEGIIAGNLIGTNDITDLTNPALGNAGPGIDIRLSGDSAITDLASVGSLIDRPELIGMIIGAHPDEDLGYVGNIIVHNDDGIRVRRRDSAIIDNFLIAENVIQNNLNDGIDIVGEHNGIPFGVEEILNFEIVRNQILSNGFFADGSQWQRDANGDVIFDAFGTPLGIPGLVAGRGIQLRADAGVVLEVNIADNIVSGNRMSGIEARTFTDTHNFLGRDISVSIFGGDDGVIYGTWERNLISDNGFIVRENEFGNGVADLRVEGHGIALGRIDFVDPDITTGIVEGFNNGGVLIPDRDGDGIPDHPLLLIQDNQILDNAEDGLHIYVDKNPVFTVATGENRTSRIDVLRNDIAGNGEDGINIHNPNARLLMNINDNYITENGRYSGVFQIQQAHGTAGQFNTVNVIGDGIEIVTTGGLTELNVARNRIKHNDGRGVNIFTGDVGSYLIATFENNNISSNSREGFYMVNAPLRGQVLATTGIPAGGIPRSGYTANSWLADFDSNHEMFTYGHLGAGALGAAGNTPPPVINPFLITWVNNNIGPGANTDLIFRSNIVDNNGGVVPDADGEPPYSTLGGFVMRVGTDGIMDPNDPSFPIPGFTGGVRALVENNRFSGNYGRDVLMDGFVATQPPNFSIMPDPLIRIDMQFRNNRGGSIDVSGNNFEVYYNNTAPAPAGNAKSPNPPFGNAARLRHAASNHGMVGLLGPFPGLGLPTLRIEVDGSTPDAFGNFIGNNEFNVIYDDFNPIWWLSVPNGTLFP